MQTIRSVTSNIETPIVDIGEIWHGLIVCDHPPLTDCATRDVTKDCATYDVTGITQYTMNHRWITQHGEMSVLQHWVQTHCARKIWQNIRRLRHSDIIYIVLNIRSLQHHNVRMTLTYERPCIAVDCNIHTSVIYTERGVTGTFLNKILQHIRSDTVWPKYSVVTLWGRICQSLLKISLLAIKNREWNLNKVIATS